MHQVWEACSSKYIFVHLCFFVVLDPTSTLMAARMEASFFLRLVWDISTKKAHKGYLINNILYTYLFQDLLTQRVPDTLGTWAMLRPLEELPRSCNEKQLDNNDDGDD